MLMFEMCSDCELSSIICKSHVNELFINVFLLVALIRCICEVMTHSLHDLIDHWSHETKRAIFELTFSIDTYIFDLSQQLS